MPLECCDDSVFRKGNLPLPLRRGGWVVFRLMAKLSLSMMKPKRQCSLISYMSTPELPHIYQYPVSTSLYYTLFVIVIQKTCFKVKVLKTFKILSNCQIKHEHLLLNFITLISVLLVNFKTLHYYNSWSYETLIDCV